MTTSATLTATPVAQDFDRLKEVKQFDDSKIGVKGLVDSGLTSIPRIFHHPPENLPSPKPKPTAATQPDITLPVIDLSGLRSTVIDQIKQSASTFGFFQITNHGIPQSLLDSFISSMKSFNEQSPDIKKQYYHRDVSRDGIAYSTNFDLYQSKAASWRDTVQMRMAPIQPDWDCVPEVMREPAAEWDREMARLGDNLLGLLSEGLGTERDRLKDLSCLDARVMAGHYYPYCPQPDLTVGLTSHTDPGVFTVLVQNEMVGLQVKHGDAWVEVKPVPGALIINIGDILQIMSNDEYKSVEHRVVANAFHDPRVSVSVFFNPGKREEMFGPLSELVSPEKPAVYRHFPFSDFMKRFFTKELDGNTLTNYYRI